MVDIVLLVTVAAILCLFLNAILVLRKVSILRQRGYDPYQMPLVFYLDTMGLEATAIWVSLIALALVVFR